MNIYRFYLLLILCCGACVAPETIPHLEGKYERARNLEDYHTAMVYLHELYDLEGPTHSIISRMAFCYFEMRNYSACVDKADKALEKANELEKVDLLTLKTKAYIANNQYLEAVGVYLELAKIDSRHNLEYFYQIGVLYNAVNDIGNSLLYMEKVIQHPLSRTVEKRLETPNIGTEAVSYYEAGMNYKGTILVNTNEWQQALVHYEKLLSAYPKFGLAQDNYLRLKELLKREKK